MQGCIACVSLGKNGSLINLACERRRASEIGIADRVNDLGATEIDRGYIYDDVPMYYRGVGIDVGHH